VKESKSEIEFYYDEEPIDSIIDESLYSFSSNSQASKSESDLPNLINEKQAQKETKTKSLNEGLYTKQVKSKNLTRAMPKVEQIFRVIKYQ
jgi:hypothetical protein